ncbi:class I SAM-dependent methyltransferase [Pedobacter agri]|uniref:class I SAM-dependent methyltransferase n=1 Tax=Pedobacter agri TaxID=454586 RepID=UPI0029315889|nr:class I SAM-dependent methyltransferase [Pedobacter agri]
MTKTKSTWSGERLETHIFTENMAEHLHRYAFAMQFIMNKRVLDIACGEGYGSNLLAEKASYVYGVDISNETIVSALDKYIKPNLEFKCGSTSLIPLSDHSIDVVISFETIEHHDEHDQMMNEIIRVLKPDGLLIVSSPDKRNYSDITNHKNPFHVKELYQNEFRNLINDYFEHVLFYDQKYISGSLILPSEEISGFKYYSGNYEKLNVNTAFNPVYNLAIASNYILSHNPASFFYDHKAIDAARNEISDRLTNTYTWKIAAILIKPFRFLKKILQN